MPLPHSDEVLHPQQLRQRALDAIPRDPLQGVQLASLALTAARRTAEPSLVAACMHTMAEALNFIGSFAGAIELAREAVALWLRLDHPSAAASSYLTLAYACTELKQPQRAAAHLEQAQTLLGASALPADLAEIDLLTARIHRCRGQYARAIECATRARDRWAAAGNTLQAARCDIERARSLFLVDAEQAQVVLDQARAVFEELGYQPESALCTYFKALALQETNHYRAALDLLSQARAVFERHSMRHYAALADSMSCVNWWRLNRFAEAIACGERARAIFASQGHIASVAMADVNLAVVYYSRNQYAEALALYRQAAELCLQEELLVEAARCHENMALVYEKLGRYDQALTLHLRARQVFFDQGLDVYTAICNENLAATYRWLGQHDAALRHYAQARATFAQRALPVYVARCDTQMADIYRTLGRWQEALDHLEQARALCAREGMTLHVAACERALAQVQAQTGQEMQALTLLAQAHAAFTQEGMAVDAALCDLAAAEARLRLGQYDAAQVLFAAALPVLAPGLPDQAWRARYGMGLCALAQNKPEEGLTHLLAAVQDILRGRALLPVERLSASFFADRRQVYEEALDLALRLGAVEQALIVVEASKAPPFAFRLSHLGVAQADATSSDPYLKRLLEQESTLRREMETLRRRLITQTEEPPHPIVNSARGDSGSQAHSLSQMARLAQAYEEVIDHLRLNAPRLAEVRQPPPFALEKLRDAAANLGVRWACLEYYLRQDTLTLFYLDQDRLWAETRPLNAYDRMALRQCAGPEPDFRELIYRGTARGRPAPGAAGSVYLQHLHRLLIPPAVAELGPEDLLILAPHGILHWLPFAALLDGDQPLAVRTSLTYLPTLGAVPLLSAQPRRSGSLQRALVCGLSDFDGRARSLPHTSREVAAIQELWEEGVCLLWGPSATREALLRLNQDGGLARYDILHFATHAILDRWAPSQSRLLLADGDLTLVDVLDLNLDAQVVILSACAGAAGHLEAGDEMMGLARAFLLAGARSVVASLWEVEDAAAHEFMTRFYQALRDGAGVTRALQTTQVEMASAGFSAYQWAPFIAIGWP